ncbi:hypothetical protein HpBT060_14820 [Helicobacter pylori]
MANIINKPIQNIWASKTANIEASSSADAQGILYGAEIISNQLNGALNTLSNQVAFNQYNGGQYNQTLSYNVGNVVSLYYRASESVSYVKTFFKCINDNGGNGITNISPINGGNSSVESGITFVTGGSFNTTNWSVLEKKDQPNVIYHSNNSYTLESLKSVGSTYLENGGGVQIVALGWGYLFSLPKNIPSAIATQGQPMVVTERIRIQWSNNLANMFNIRTFNNFSSNPNFSFNQATNDKHDYIITLEAKYNESGSLVNYDLEFSDFNCQIAQNTIPTFLTMGVRSASALFEVDGGSSVPYKLFSFINPLSSKGSICGPITITFLNSGTILQTNQSHASALGNVDINTIDTSKCYKIGRGLGTKTLKKIGEFKYTNQPTIYQEDGWYDLAILTEVEKYLCNGGVYNTNASSYFTGHNNPPYLTPLNTDGSTIPFNPVNNASGIYKWLLLPSYIQGSILQDGSNIYQCFMSMAQEGLTSIGLLSMNNALNPTNVSKNNQSFTEQFLQQFQQDNKPGMVIANTIGTTTKYGTLNYIKMSLNNYCTENIGEMGVNTMSYPSNGNGNTPQDIPSPVYLWYTQQHIYNYDRQGRTNSSFSAPASIYCSLAIRVG